MEINKITFNTSKDQLLKRIDTCITYINACQIRFDINTLMNETSLISKKELERRQRKTSDKLMAEVVLVNAYIAEITEPELAEMLSEKVQQSLKSVKNQGQLFDR